MLITINRLLYTFSKIKSSMYTNHCEYIYKWSATNYHHPMCGFAKKYIQWVDGSWLMRLIQTLQKKCLINLIQGMDVSWTQCIDDSASWRQHTLARKHSQQLHIPLIIMINWAELVGGGAWWLMVPSQTPKFNWVVVLKGCRPLMLNAFFLFLVM